MTGSRARSSTRFGQWIGVAGITWSLHLLGGRRLAGPPLTQPDGFLAWWQDRGTVLATFSITREALFWVGCYLGLLWTVALIATLFESARLLAALARSRLPGAKVLVRAAVGASALGAVIIAGAPPSFAMDVAGSGGANPVVPTTGSVASPTLRYIGIVEPAPVLRPVRPSPPSTQPTPARTLRPISAAPPSTPPIPPRTLRPASPAPPSTRPAPALHPTTTSPPATQPAPLPASRPEAAGDAGVRPEPGDRWTVRPGDDLWSIAAATLTKAWGHPPADADLGRYWWHVIQANRSHLPDPADPSLLFPGDVVALPRPPPPPR